MSLRVRCLNLPVATFILYTKTLPLSSTAAYELQPVSSGPFGELIKSRKMPSDIRGQGKADGIGCGSYFLLLYRHELTSVSIEISPLGSEYPNFCPSKQHNCTKRAITSTIPSLN